MPRRSLDGWRRSGALDSQRAGLAASCIVYLSDPAVVDSAGDGMTRFGGAFKRAHGLPSSEAREAREVFGACGAACLIRRDLFDDIGGFDEAYFAVHEDVDLSYRCQLLGYHCIYCPEAVVHHAGSGTLGRVSARSVFWGQRNLEWTYVKNTRGRCCSYPPGPRAVQRGRHLRAPVTCAPFSRQNGTPSGNCLACGVSAVTSSGAGIPCAGCGS